MIKINILLTYLENIYFFCIFAQKQEIFKYGYNY